MKWKSFTTALILSALSASGATLYTPWTSFRGTNQVVITTNPSTATLVIGPATPISTTASNAAKSLMVWTNDAGMIRSIAPNLPVRADLALWIGTNALETMLNYVSSSNGVLVGLDASAGGPQDSVVGTVLKGPGGFTFTSGFTTANTNRVYTFYEVENDDLGILDTLELSAGTNSSLNRFGPWIQGRSGLAVNAEYFRLIPFQGNPYVFKSAPLGESNLLSVMNSITNAFAISHGGKLWSQGGMATNVATFDFITTNLLSGQTYTNFAQRGHVVATAILTNVLAGDVSAMSLIVDQNGDGTWDTTNGPARLNGVALLAGEQQLAGLLQPGARFAFTNQSAGATPGSALIRPGSCQWSRW